MQRGRPVLEQGLDLSIQQVSLFQEVSHLELIGFVLTSQNTTWQIHRPKHQDSVLLSTNVHLPSLLANLCDPTNNMITSLRLIASPDGNHREQPVHTRHCSRNRAIRSILEVIRAVAFHPDRVIGHQLPRRHYGPVLHRPVFIISIVTVLHVNIDIPFNCVMYHLIVIVEREISVLVNGDNVHLPTLVRLLCYCFLSLLLRILITGQKIFRGDGGPH